MSGARIERTLWAIAIFAVPALAPAADAPRPDAPPGTVTLPLADYDRLVDRAARPPQPPSPPPVPAVLARADLRLAAGESDVRGTMTLQGEVLRAGPTLVPLLAGGTVLDARLSGKPLPLVANSAGLAAVVTGPGPFSILVEWGTPIVQEPGLASFTLSAPAAGTVRVSLEVAGGAADVRLAPGIVTRRSTAGGRTTVEATLDPASSVRFSWTSREVAAPAVREARFLSDVKTLITVGEADLRMASLVEIVVVQGAPERFALRLPAGFEVTSVSGASLEKTEEAKGALTLMVRDTARRRHQFLVTLERGNGSGSTTTEAELPSLEGAQRETGEAAVEGLGTLELTATEGEGLRRMDVREAAPALRSMAREPLLAAFRYQRKTGVQPRLGLDVRRYPSAPVLAAMAERAVVTTLATSEGRTLTEVALTVRNHAQPFLKVGLPDGSTLLSAEVAGEGVKPVKGEGGTRVPLLRAGFRPDGPYAVSFVYIQPGAPFAKKGDARLAVPRMDVPIGVLEWEVFLPQRYRVKRFDGEAVPAALMAGAGAPVAVGALGTTSGLDLGLEGGVPADTGRRGSGQVWGRITDESGAALPGVTITLQGSGVVRHAVTDGQGEYVIAGIPPGTMRLAATMPGFSSRSRDVILREGSSLGVNFNMTVAGVREEIAVMAEPATDANAAAPRKRAAPEQQNVPSANVMNLQRRVAGVLPVRMDIPRAGASYRFVRPLVVDEETSVSVRYSTR